MVNKITNIYVQKAVSARETEAGEGEGEMGWGSTLDRKAREGLSKEETWASRTCSGGTSRELSGGEEAVQRA